MRPRTTDEWERLEEVITSEDRLSLAEAARLVPVSVRRATGGKRKHASTRSVKRWILDGIKGVRLDGCLLNGEGWSTSRQALRRFRAALSQRAEMAAGVGVRTESPAVRESRAKAAGRELDALLA